MTDARSAFMLVCACFGLFGLRTEVLTCMVADRNRSYISAILSPSSSLRQTLTYHLSQIFASDTFPSIVSGRPLDLTLGNPPQFAHPCPDALSARTEPKQPTPIAVMVPAPTLLSNGHTEDKVPTMFDSVPETIEAVKRGEFVIVLDDEDRENEGDLIIPAQNITTEQMAWFIRHTR